MMGRFSEMDIERRKTMGWTNEAVEQQIRDTRYTGKITDRTKLHALALVLKESIDPASEHGQLIQRAIDHDLEHIDFLHYDSINCSLMGVGLELAYLEGHTPEPHNREDFIRSLMRSTVPPAVVLQWVGIALGVAVPKEITVAVECLRDREAVPRKTEPWLRTHTDWAAEQDLIEIQSNPDWRELMEGFVAYARRQYWCGVHDSRNMFRSR